jgi:hypothetical protein
MTKKMISPSEFAVKIGRPYPTVMAWLKKDLIQGVERHQVGKSVIYAIPEDAKYTEPSMGRPKKPDEADAVEATRKSAPVKPVKKRATKKTK